MHLGGDIFNEYECIASCLVDDDRTFVRGRGESTETFGPQEALEVGNSPDFIDKIVPLDCQFRMIGGGILS
jgi:hypothetical protein